MFDNWGILSFSFTNFFLFFCFGFFFFLYVTSREALKRNKNAEQEKPNNRK